MKKSVSTQLMERLFARTGGWYPILGLLLAQLVTGPLGLLLTAIPVHLNTELSGEEVVNLVVLGAILMLVRNILLLVVMYFSSRDMFTLLSKRARDHSANPKAEQQKERAWRQVSSFPWRYIAIAYSALIVFVLLPVLGYMSIVMQASAEQMIYVFLSALASASGFAILEILIIDFWLNMIRPVLLPAQFETQLAGVKGLRFRPKFEISILALIIVIILLIAPIGYRQSTLMLFSESRSPHLLTNVLYQLAIASMSGLLLGIVISRTIARSLSDPIFRMIDTFQELEKGNLNQRVKVVSTDETGELAIYFNHLIDRLQVAQTSLENVVEERTRTLTHQLSMLQTASQVAQVTTEAREPGLLLSEATRLIADHLGYYHVGIFLTEEEGQSVSLKAAAAEGGGATLKHDLSIKVDRQSIIGNAAHLGKTYLANDVSKESLFTENPELPLTRAEVAIPIRWRNTILGVLDIQSTAPHAFSDENINVLETIAGQIALVTQNQRLETGKRDAERQVESLATQSVRQSWESRSHQPRRGYRYTTAGLFPSEKSTSEPKDANRLDIPIALRGQKIGVITLQRKSEAPWTSVDQTLAQEIANQVALALENARLLDEARQRATREQAINELTGRFTRSLDPEVLLQTAVRELHQLPNVTEVSVYLMPPEEKAPDDSSN